MPCHDAVLSAHQQEHCCDIFHNVAEAYPPLGGRGPPPVRVPQSRMAKHRSASEGEDSPDSRGASGCQSRHLMQIITAEG